MVDKQSSARAQESRSFVCAIYSVLKEKKILSVNASDGTRCQMINFLYISVLVDRILDFGKYDVIDMGTAKSHRSMMTRRIMTILEK